MKIRAASRALRTSAATAALLLTCVATASAFELEAIALTGDVAPDMGGQTYEYLSGSWTGPVVNDAGLVGFQASFPTGRALFIATPQSGALYALEGAPATGTGGVYTCMCNDGGVTLDDRNRILFDAWVSTISGSVALAADSSTFVTPLVQAGDPLPAPADAVTSVWSIARREDTLLYEAWTSGAGRGLFREKDDVASTIVLRGDPVPGRPPFIFDFLAEGTRMAGPDAAGRVAFQNMDFDRLTTGVFLWSEAAGVETVAYTGDPAPGTGANFSSLFLDPQLNDDGVLLFGGRLDDPAETRGIFRYDGGAITLLLKNGDVAPGTGGRTYDRIFPALLDDPGAVVFLATLQSGAQPAGAGIFRLADGVVLPVVLTGDVAPGTGGATFTGLSVTNTPEAALSPSGHFLAFSADLSDGRRGVFRGSRVAAVPALPFAGRLLLGLGLVVAAGAFTRRRARV